MLRAINTVHDAFLTRGLDWVRISAEQAPLDLEVTRYLEVGLEPPHRTRLYDKGHPTYNKLPMDSPSISKQGISSLELRSPCLLRHCKA